MEKVTNNITAVVGLKLQPNTPPRPAIAMEMAKFCKNMLLSKNKKAKSKIAARYDPTPVITAAKTVCDPRKIIKIKNTL